MNERQKIEESLRKKEQEIHSLREKIKVSKVYVKALRDVLKLLDKGNEAEAAESTLRQGSAVAQARDVILEREMPVHIGDLLGAMGKPQTRESRSSLASSLAAYVRRGEIFARTAPNTFGLIVLGHHSEEVKKNPVPPTGFGQLSPTSPPSPSPPMPDDDDDDVIPF
jgi:hypothetical protein